MGSRGDAILQLDWTVGEVLKTLDSLKIADNTLLIFSSDNPKPQLYNLKEDIGEKNNLAEKYPEEVKKFSDILKQIKEKNQTR